jgi:hypothetical protein
VFGNRAIANVALQSQFGQARFHGAFSGSACDPRLVRTAVLALRAVCL